MGEKLAYSILFVEDELEIRKNYIEFLKRHYEKVFEASSAEEGYSIYKKYKPHIMIVDINLVQMNGLELVREIRAVDQNVKVIVLTANSSKDFLLDAVDLKLTKYLIKPISRSELKGALELAKDEIINYSITSRQIVILKDNYTWSQTQKELFKGDLSIKLTGQEKKILSLFFNNQNVNISYEKISDEIWDEYDSKKIDAIKTAMKQIRKKLPHNTIKNIYGYGYTLEV